MGNSIAIDVYRDIPLPHFVWICEISSPALYPREVMGEVIWDATRNAYEPDGWTALHYPEVIIVDIGSALNRPQNLKKIRLDLSTNYPVYRSNLKEI